MNFKFSVLIHLVSDTRKTTTRLQLAGELWQQQSIQQCNKNRNFGLFKTNPFRSYTNLFNSNRCNTAPLAVGEQPKTPENYDQLFHHFSS